MYCKVCPQGRQYLSESIENHILLKDPERHKAKLLEIISNQKENEDEEAEEIPQQQNSEKEADDLFNCYYCIDFLSTKGKNEYQNHVSSNHPEWPAYPSVADLKRLGIYAQEKEWEI